MLNLFQHLSINREIPKQVRNDMGVGISDGGVGNNIGFANGSGFRSETSEKEVQATTCRGSGGAP